MKAYKGTILLVCHEPEFYKDWVTKVWDVETWAKKILSPKIIPLHHHLVCKGISFEIAIKSNKEFLIIMQSSFFLKLNTFL